MASVVPLCEPHGAIGCGSAHDAILPGPHDRGYTHDAD